MVLSRIAQFIEAHWRLAISPAGAALISWGAYVLSIPNSYLSGIIYFSAGVLLMLAGTIVSSGLMHSNAKLSNKLLTIEQRLQERSKNSVFFLVSSFTEEWQCELNNYVFQSFRQSNLVCTPTVPYEYYSVGEHQALLNKILNDADYYCGGIVTIPVWPPDKIDELIRFAVQLNKPVVFVDQNPSLSEKEIPSNVSFVSVSDSDGGELAAKSIIEMSQERPLRRILVMGGYAKQRRQERFQQIIQDTLQGCDVIVSEDGNHNREMSEKMFHNIFMESFDKNQPIDAVFCTADSISLGCLDAISRIHDWNGQHKPRIVSYDGVFETRRLVESGNSPLERIVVQDAKDVARAAVEQLNLMLQRRKARKIVWVKPYIYPRLKKSSKSEGTMPTYEADRISRTSK